MRALVGFFRAVAILLDDRLDSGAADPLGRAQSSAWRKRDIYGITEARLLLRTIETTAGLIATSLPSMSVSS
jgi:hypothetical protein